MKVFGFILTFCSAFLLAAGVPIVKNINFSTMLSNIDLPHDQWATVWNEDFFQYYINHYCPVFFIVGIFCIILGFHFSKIEGVKS